MTADSFDFGAPPTLAVDEVDEARAALDVYRAAPRGSSPAAVDRAMAKLIVAYPSARLAPVEAKARLDLYAEQLSDIPADVLMAAAMQAVRTLKFFPAISELRECAGRVPATPRQRRQYRLQAMIAEHERKVALPPPEAPVAAEEVSALLGSITQRLVDKGEVARPIAPLPIERRPGPPRMPTASDYAAMGIDVEHQETERARLDALLAEASAALARSAEHLADEADWPAIEEVVAEESEERRRAA